MNFISLFYTELIWRPLFNGLVLSYNALPVHDLGLAIIVFTVMIRLLMAPLMWRGQKAQNAMTRLQPELEKLKSQYKNDREGFARATMELYQRHNVNPFSGCLNLLIQLPILIALFSVFRDGFRPDHAAYLYSFVSNPGAINPLTFGGLDLSKGSIALGVVSALTQFYATKVTMTPPAARPPGTENDFSRLLQQQALYILPVIILIWSRTLPSALTLYWTVLNIFGIVQGVMMTKKDAAGAPPSS
ncbi:MAG: YidC/Oxa1 family membrane protein insertase [Patescibacteria group bacterium]